MDLKATYNKIAENWDQDHIADTWWIEGCDKFTSLLKKGARVLDVGCGSGLFSKFLTERGFDVSGFDFSDKMVELAKKKVPQGKFEVRDIYDVNGIKGKFYAIFARAVILHIPKNKAGDIVRRLADKLDEGGYLYIAVKEIRPDQPEEAVLKENDYGFEYERFFSYFTLDEIKKYIIDAGLKLSWSAITPSGETNWIQVIGKKSK